MKPFHLNRFRCTWWIAVLLLAIHLDDTFAQEDGKFWKILKNDFFNMDSDRFRYGTW